MCLNKPESRLYSFEYFSINPWISSGLIDVNGEGEGVGLGEGKGVGKTIGEGRSEGEGVGVGDGVGVGKEVGLGLTCGLGNGLEAGEPLEEIMTIPKITGKKIKAIFIDIGLITTNTFSNPL